MTNPFDDMIQRLAGALADFDAKSKGGLLYLFMDEQEKVLDCDWFDGHVTAINHARTLDAPLVNVLLYVGSAENENESFHLAKDAD